MLTCVNIDDPNKRDLFAIGNVKKLHGFAYLLSMLVTHMSSKKAQ